jgi:hypothetical protein
MACQRNGEVCRHLVISSAVTFTAGTGLIINIPEGSYADGCKYCIVVAQTIPAETTITAPVFITIGDGTELYPLNKCDCTQATACSIRTRTKYSTRVETSATTGVFKLLGNIPCAPNNNLTAINGTAPTTAGA